MHNIVPQHLQMHISIPIVNWMKGICFSELCESQNSRNNNKKNPYKLKAKLTGEAPHHASEQFVNEEAITECNSHLYAAAGEIGGWRWVFVRVCTSVCDGGRL